MQVSEKLFNRAAATTTLCPSIIRHDDIFWTCIKFQNRVFLRGAQLFILARICVYIYEMLALRGEGADAISTLTPSMSTRTGKRFPTKRPRNAQNISKSHPGLSSDCDEFSHVFSQGSALALKIFRIMLLFLMLMLD